MLANHSLSCLTGAALAVMLGTGSVQAHDPSGKGGIPPEYVKRMLPVNKAMLGMDDSDQAKGVYAKVVQWPPDFAKLRVCFMGGNDQINLRIAQIASRWTDDPKMSIKFAFTVNGKPRKCDPNAKESQIRVSYNKPGYWSLLGQSSTLYAKQDEPSLNLEKFDQATDMSVFDKPDVQGVILHEFGHALGLMHEHQSPAADCVNEFNWDYLNKQLAGPPNNWDKQTIETNMAPYVGEDLKLMLTDFDAKSVMLYYFPPDYYLKGKQASCYIPSPNDDISATDRETIEFMYPADQGQRITNFADSKAQFMKIWDKSGDAGTRDATLNLPALYFTAAGVKADDPD